MKSAPILFACLSLVLFIYSSCEYSNDIIGSSDIVEFEVPFENFEAISISGLYEVEITQEASEKVTIICNSNIKEYLEYEQNGSTLNFETKNLNVRSNMYLLVKIHAKQLNKIAGSGATKIKLVNGSFKDLTVSLSGASKLKSLATNSSNLILDASGASSMRFEGKTKKISVELSGASKLKAKNLSVAENTVISCSGASHASIKTNSKLSLDLSGASELICYGNPTIIHKSISGVSELIKR